MAENGPQRRKLKPSEFIFAIICLLTVAVGTFLILNIYGQRFGLVPMLIAAGLLLFVGISLAIHVRPQKPAEHGEAVDSEVEDSPEKDL